MKGFVDLWDNSLMALQSQRRTKSSKKMRASHFALKKKNLAICPQCGKPIKPHMACRFCGTYKNKVVLKTKNDNAVLKTKKNKKDVTKKKQQEG